VRNGQISAVVRSQPDNRRCAVLHTGTNGQQKLILGTCAVGAAQWAHRGRTSKVTETAREARHVAMGKRESTSPATQAEARGEHMSDHPGRCSMPPPAPNCTRPQEAKRGTTQGGEPELWPHKTTLRRASTYLLSKTTNLQNSSYRQIRGQGRRPHRKLGC